MNYNEAIEYIHSIPKFVRPLGNENLSKLLDALDNPQNNLKFIHVAGTNGKGSVCAMLAEILKRAGYKVGLFTSPFIEIFNERICINNEMISDDALAVYTSIVSEIMIKNNAQVSEFAFITAMAFLYYSDMQCDVVVLETGMGGRLDATNIISSPEVAVLTEIGMDHTQYLGNTIEKIAIEKCGIIKENCEVVTAPNDRVISIISTEAKQKKVCLTVCEKAISQKNKFVYKTWSYHLALKGEYQAENASIVLETINALIRRNWIIPASAIVEGFKNVRWKARYEFITDNIIIDGGHNIDGVRALKASLKKENKPIVLVIAMMKDKSYDVCIHTIIGVATHVIATQIDMERSLKAEEILRICNSAGVDCIIETNIEKAIEKAVEISQNKLVCVCGSLYLAGEAENILKSKGKS